MEATIWTSNAMPRETTRDAAERFVREYFDADRSIVWGSEPGEFRFADGAWCYRITAGFGVWQVSRLDKLTPRAGVRQRSRRKAKGKDGVG